MNHFHTDDIIAGMNPALSAKALQILELNAGQAYTRLVVTGTGHEPARLLLQSLQPKDLLIGPIRRQNEADCLLSALWLWHDFLDESHTLSQKITSPSGSFWHAIMHRREGDFANSKYWYAKCRTHPAHEVLRAAKPDWDAFAFVDLAEEAHHNPTHARLKEIVELQKLEWQVLFETCLAVA